MTESIGIFGLAILYRIMTLFVGLAFAYMGYRLFLADKTKPAGTLEAKNGAYAVSLQGGAPGVFFCLLGTVLICVSVTKGLKYDPGGVLTDRKTEVPIVIPPNPPV